VTEPQTKPNIPQSPIQLTPDDLVGSIQQETEGAPIPGATWYTAQAVGDGVVYRFPAGALAGAKYLSADMLLDGTHKTAFLLTLQEGEGGPRFGLKFSLLNQASRGKAFRVYLEDAAAKPWCVGVHYFTLYDQSALGRFDGENYQIGFLDVCNRPYGPLADAARESHERLYQVASGLVAPYDDEPEYLPLLF
jgi:hypothetical protein